MKLLYGDGFSRRVRKVGANALTFLLALAAPPQAANAILYLTGDGAAPEAGIWRRVRVMVSNHVLHSHRTNTSSDRS